jgi:hypothetical protein
MKRLKSHYLLGYAIAFSIIGMAAAITSYALPKQERKFTITLSEQEINIVLQGLSEMPLKLSGNLYSNILQQTQYQYQLQSQQQKNAHDTLKKKQ